MRIVQLNAVPNVSTGRLATELHRQAAANGAESLFLYTAGESAVPGVERIASPAGERVHALLSRLTGLQGYWSRHNTRRIIRRIREFHPDAVHLHNLHNNNINLGMLFRFLARERIPVCVTLHDCFFFTGHCCYYTAVGCDRWRDACGNCPQMRAYNTSWLFDTSRRALADKKRWFSALPALTAVGVSRWIGEQAAQSFLGTAGTVTSVYNWVDGTVFKPCAAPRDPASQGKFVILGVAGAWGDRKGLPDFQKLATMLAPDEELWLVGNCDELLPPSVRHIPATGSAAELARIYAQADVFVSLSRQETFGLVIAEALSCGTPAVVYDNTAQPELIGEGCGAVCPTGDVEAVLAAVRQIREKGRAAYSDTCTAFARAQFDLTRNVARYYEIYRSMR